MATQRIESGQMQIRSVGSVPMVQAQQQSVDYIGPRVAAQGASQLAQILDRMSASAFESAAELRSQEGLQFAAENQLTQEELDRAKGDNPEGPLAEPTGIPTTKSVGYFARAVAKARSFELASHFEREGRNEMAKLLVDVDNGLLTSDQAKSKITNIITGYSKSDLARVDPEAMIKFRATMAVHGDTVRKAAYEKEAVKLKETKEITFNLDNTNRTTLLKQDIAEGVMVAEKIDVHRKSLILEVVKLGDAGKQKLALKEFEANVVQMKIDVVSTLVTDTGFAPDAMTAIARLDKGDAGKMSGVWSTMAFEDKAKVRQNLRTTQIERQTTQDLAEKSLQEKDLLDAAALQTEFFKTGSKDALQKLQAISIRSPKVISPEAVFDLPAKRKIGEVVNEKAEFVLKNEIFKGLHPTQESVEKRARELGIGYKQLNTITPFFVARNSADQNDVERIFRAESKIVPGQSNLTAKQSAAFIALEKAFARDYPAAVAQAVREGKPPPTQRQVAESIRDKRTSSVASKKIENALKDLNDLYGATGTMRKTGIVFTDESSFNDIQKEAGRLGLKTPDLDSIRQRLQIVEQQRQILDSQ
jgi:hypothetical protein